MLSTAVPGAPCVREHAHMMGRWGSRCEHQVARLVVWLGDKSPERVGAMQGRWYGLSLEVPEEPPAPLLGSTPRPGITLVSVSFPSCPPDRELPKVGTQLPCFFCSPST